MSVPTPRGLPFIAIRAPSPPLEPPHVKSRLCGFVVSPKTGFVVSPSCAFESMCPSLEEREEAADFVKRNRQRGPKSESEEA